MTLPLDASVGSPRLLHVPEYESSTGLEACELAEMAGLFLDDWQRLVLQHALGEMDGGWAAFEVGVEVSRQNGKGAILEARELAGLFLLGERLLIHSAHEFATSLEAFHRMLGLIESAPELQNRIRRVSRSHGEEGIELKGGQRIRYKTRTAGGGRGFSCDCLILDEAMNIPERMHAALLPTLSARPNPQVWYTGSAVDQETMENGVVFARVRERGMLGRDPALAYFGWSAPFDHPDAIGAEALNPDVWAQANPGLGIRISREHVAREQRSMDPRTFAVERLSVGDWPATDGSAGQKIPDEVWEACTDALSQPKDPVCFAFDVTPDRKHGCIAVAGYRDDGLAHLEIVELRRGTGWMADRLVELAQTHSTAAVVYSDAGPAASLAVSLEGEDEPSDLELRLKELDVILKPANSRDEAKACGMLVDALDPENGQTVMHLGTTELAQAIKGAATRPLGDSWAWARKTSRANIAPLVGVTLALWGLKTSDVFDSTFVFEVM